MGVSEAACTATADEPAPDVPFGAVLGTLDLDEAVGTGARMSSVAARPTAEAFAGATRAALLCRPAADSPARGSRPLPPWVTGPDRPMSR